MNIRSRGFDRTDMVEYMVEYGTYGAMLIEISKQIGYSFAKIINTMVNSKPCQTVEMELFSQVVTGFRGELRILPYT